MRESPPAAGARFVVAGGHRLEVAGVAGRAPTLVLLHEGLGSVAHWRTFPADLANATGLGVLVYSRWGYGRSDPVTPPRPLTYMHDEAKGALPELLDAEGIDRAILVGHSDGASIAILHAGSARAKPRIEGLVLMAPHVFVEALSVASIAEARAAYEREGSDLRPRLAKYHDDVDGAFWGWNRAWLDPGFRAWNIEASLSHIDVPVLVVQGAADAYGTMAQVDAIARGVRGTFERVVLDGVGHSPQREAPAATLAAITGFVARYSSDAAQRKPMP
jgi:pimeloyl-ACP methyl ester carboxylesterase